MILKAHKPGLCFASGRVIFAVKKFIHEKNTNHSARKRNDRPRNLTRIRRLIVQVSGDRDDQRQRHEMEFIFDNEFVEWDETSYGNIMQVAGWSKFVFYNWHENWLANHSWSSWNDLIHGRQHRILSMTKKQALKNLP
jgi:hypothetical protein